MVTYCYDLTNLIDISVERSYYYEKKGDPFAGSRPNESALLRQNTENQINIFLQNIQNMQNEIIAMQRDPNTDPAQKTMMEFQLQQALLQFTMMHNQWSLIVNQSQNARRCKKTVELLSYFKKKRTPKITSADNNIYCSTKCHKTTSTLVTENYLFFPNVLCIFLNYGREVKFNCKVNFEEKLDLGEFALNYEHSPKKFNLIGVVVYRGSSGDSGHYIAYCRHFDGQWYCFNDAVVTKCAFSDCKANGELPYVLFYVKEELDY